MGLQHLGLVLTWCNDVWKGGLPTLLHIRQVHEYRANPVAAILLPVLVEEIVPVLQSQAPTLAPASPRRQLSHHMVGTVLL